MASAFEGFPDERSLAATTKARVILRNAHITASAFLEIFAQLRGKKRGTPSDPEQDLLRAMLLFACAGLDAMVKQLVRDALPAVLILAKNAGADAALKTFLARRTRDAAGGADHKFLAEILTSESPRTRVVEAWVDDLTGGSLQSAQELSRVAAAFGIAPSEMRAASLMRPVFEVRNQISHEMDTNFAATRTRRQRSRDSITENTQTVFTLTAQFLAAVESRLE